MIYLEGALAINAVDIVIAITFIILSYLIGAIPFGLVLGKGVKGIDIREHGSKNIGSTNSIRILGKKLGFTVFFLDVFKGMFIIAILMILKALGAWSSPIDYLWYGAAAIIGHSFSIFLDFKGGKAVATSLGVVLILSPLSAIMCLLIFGLIVLLTGYVSLASTAAALTVVTTGWVLYGVGIESTSFLTYFIASPGLPVCLLFTIATGLIILKHRKNYIRLLNGTENSFKKKKKHENE